jgi:hypothetical protein
MLRSSPRAGWCRAAIWAGTAVALLCAAAPARRVAAQPVLYNNYNHLPTGDVAALQGGAFIARANDASAGWYNPAGLVRAEHDAISGNASLYGYNRVAYDGSGAATDYSTTPTFIGTLSRDVVSGTANSAWGFSIVTPLNVQNASKRNFVQSYDVTPFAVPDVNTVLTDTTQATLFAPGIAWSRALGSDSSFGYGLRLYQFTINGSTSSIFSQPLSGGSPYFSAVENIAFSFEATLARVEAGWQTRLSDALRLGVVVRSATSELRAKGRVLTNFQQYFVPGPNPVSVFASADDGDVGTEYRLPWELGLGLAWVQPEWEVELDATYYRKIDPYKLVHPIDVLVITNIGGTPNSGTAQEPGVTFEGRSFTNVALGGRMRMGEATWLNGGLYTDRSPGTSSGNELFSRVDFTGITLGATLEREHSTTSMGVVYLQGDATESFQATPGIIPTPARTVTIEHRELSFVLAGSLSF